MKSYPIMLDLTNKQVVIIGGGRIAYRKIIGLLQAGAKITVISPEINQNIEELFIAERITWHKKEFEQADLDIAFIVIAATDNPLVNNQVALSVGVHQLVNVVDDQSLSNFHVPAKLTRGNLTISVATGGASPTLAKVIRDELAEVYDDSYKDYLVFLAKSRLNIKHTNLDTMTKKYLLKIITGEKYRCSTYMQQAFLEMVDNYKEHREDDRYADCK